MPDDESTEYLITQAIADYLAKNEGLNLDGIVFPSIQVAGKDSNIILFNKASKVEERDVPTGTEVEVTLEGYDEDGRYDEYTIYEKTPPETKPAKGVRPLRHRPMPQSPNVDKRTPSLAIDEDGIKVHDIKAVTYDTKENTVSIYRYENKEFENADDKDPLPW